MPRRMLALRLAAVVAAAAACGNAGGVGATGALTVHVDTIGAVLRVRNIGTPPAGRLEPIFEIGGAGGLGEPRPTEFGRVSSVLADDAGAVYVADSQAGEIRVFDAAGRHLRTFGREGAGPGEFGAVSSLAWLGDTIAVFDPRNARIGLVTPAGEWAGSRRFQAVTGPAVRLYRASDTVFYAFGVRFTGEESESVFIRHTAAGASDTLPHRRLVRGASAGEDPASLTICPRPDGATSFFDIPFRPRAVATPAPDGGLAIAYPGRYRIAFVTATGDTTRIIGFQRQPVPVSDVEWEAQLEDYRAFREEWPGVQCDPEMPGKPDHKPAFRALYFDPGGRLWVEAFAPEGFAWDVFAPDGRLLARYPAPPRRERVPPYWRDGRMYVVAEDTLGLHHVRAYRLVGPPGGD